MRSLSGTRNRITLLLVGLLILAASAWLIAVAFDLVPAESALASAVVPPDSTVSDVVQDNRGWLLPAGIAASVLAVLAGAALLLAQVPRPPAHTSLRLHDEDGSVLATIEPQVLERALAERVGGVPGVDEPSVRVSGSARALGVLGEVTVSDDAELAWVVEETRRVLSGDPQVALGSTPVAVDLLVHVRAARASGRGDRVAVRQQRDGGTLVSEAV